MIRARIARAALAAVALVALAAFVVVAQTETVTKGVTTTAPTTGNPVVTYQWQMSVDNGATWAAAGVSTGTATTVTIPLLAAVRVRVRGVRGAVLRSIVDVSGVPADVARPAVVVHVDGGRFTGCRDVRTALPAAERHGNAGQHMRGQGVGDQQDQDDGTAMVVHVLLLSGGLRGLPGDGPRYGVTGADRIRAARTRRA